MQIKKVNKQNFLWKKINSLINYPHRKRKKILLLLGSISLLAIISLSIYCGMVLDKIGLAQFLSEIVQLNSKIVVNYFRGLRATPERIAINIKFEDFQKVAYKRSLALTKGILISSPDDYVPARIRYQDKTLRAKLRLKGDIVDQLQGQKWPFRIVIKGEDTLFGMKVFSIHKPEARTFIYEWILHKAMQREGVIFLRYDFIDVTINGKGLGIYALEEHFEKRLIENNRRREGPIVCFSEDADFKNLAHVYMGAKQGYWQDRGVSLYKAQIDVYRPTKTLADAKLRKQFMLAKDLLESWQAGKLKTSDVFDCKILARYLALLDLFNAHHASRYGDLKFYYNPVTSKLEPICFDAEIIPKRYKKIETHDTYAENWHNEGYRFLSMLFF